MASFSTVFFDLDETLYPSDNGLWQAIGERILDFMTLRLGISRQEADSLRAGYLRNYGTTLNGLVANHPIDRLDYLDYVHDIQLERFLKPDAALRDMLSIVPQKRVVFTNATRDHARRVLHQLGIENEIDLIVDIITLDFHNKPDPLSYQGALNAAKEDDPRACLLVDDRIENLRPGTSLGMTTVLVGNRNGKGEADFSIQEITALLDAVPTLIAAGLRKGH